MKRLTLELTDEEMTRLKTFIEEEWAGWHDARRESHEKHFAASEAVAVKQIQMLDKLNVAMKSAVEVG